MQGGASTNAIGSVFSADSRATLYPGDCMELLRAMPPGVAQLVVTSPPYNLGKKYEKRAELDKYLAWQTGVIDECVRVLSPTGSICWQVGNYVRMRSRSWGGSETGRSRCGARRGSRSVRS